MLADVLKQKEIETNNLMKAEIEKYNHEYKRDTIIYFEHFHMIGGIETWVYNLAHYYEFSVVYDRADEGQIKRLNDLGIETIKNVGQKIECNNLLFCLFGDSSFIKAKKRLLFIHGVYEDIKDIGEIPEYDEIYAVSKIAAEKFEALTNLKVKVLYNPVVVKPKEKALVFGVFSRLTKEKGKWRIEYLLNKLVEKNKPFLMIIFTDLPFDFNDKRVIFLNPVLNPTGWMQICDYVVQLSDTEAGSLTIQEALKLGKPLIITKLPILEEFGINETNSKLLDFNMMNLDIDDLWNIPKVNWNEPISKEWEDIMKKRVFRERQNEVIIEEPKKEETPKKTTKKKSGK